MVKWTNLFALIFGAAVIAVIGGEERSQHPYQFVKPAPNQFMQRGPGLMQRPHDDDQMAVESIKRNQEEEVKVDDNTNLKRRRTEMLIKTRPKMSANPDPDEMPDFPNFPKVSPKEEMHLKREENIEQLPRAQPLRLREKHRLSSYKSSMADRRKRVVVKPRNRDIKLDLNLTPKAEPVYRRPPPPNFSYKKKATPKPIIEYYDDYEYYDYYDDDYYYDDEVTYKSKPTLPPPPPPPPPIPTKPKLPPRSASMTRWALNHKKHVRTPLVAKHKPPKMSDYKMTPAKNHKNLKNHRLPRIPRKPMISVRSSQKKAAETELKASPGSHHKKTRFFDEYEYYDDDEYYDDFYVQEPKRPRRRQGYGGGSSINPLALLVAPLAAISLLAAAAAVAINPVLVQVALTGKKRRRRSAADDEDEWDPELKGKMHEMQVLERFLGSIPDNVRYQQQILSMYLSCSGYTEPSNQCLDRVVCDYSTPDSFIEQQEKDVISIILYNIMANDFVGDEYKDRLRKSAKIGRDDGHDNQCRTTYQCEDLDLSEEE